MRFRLRTLMIASTAPPVLAWALVRGKERDKWGYILGALLFGAALSLIILIWRGDLHWSILEDRPR